MVKTKSVRDAIETSDGKRILVMRFWPRGRTKEKLRLHSWNRDLAPDKKLHRDWYDKIISWDQYVPRFLKLMEGQNESIEELARIAKNETITLLCFEKEDDPHCHRHLLKILIEEAMARL